MALGAYCFSRGVAVLVVLAAVLSPAAAQVTTIRSGAPIGAVSSVRAAQAPLAQISVRPTEFGGTLAGKPWGVSLVYVSIMSQASDPLVREHSQVQVYSQQHETGNYEASITISRVTSNTALNKPKEVLVRNGDQIIARCPLVDQRLYKRPDLAQHCSGAAPATAGAYFSLSFEFIGIIDAEVSTVTITRWP